MSLFSYLGAADSGSSALSSGLDMSALRQAAAQKASLSAAIPSSKSSSSAPASSTSSVSIAASIAAAAAADAKKEASALASELRASLDLQYKDGGAGGPDLSRLSGRALSVIILNQSGTFSKTEIFAARAEMRERDRSAVAAVAANGYSIAALQTYQVRQLADQAAMSAEERSVRRLD